MGQRRQPALPLPACMDPGVIWVIAQWNAVVYWKSLSWHSRCPDMSRWCPSTSAPKQGLPSRTLLTTLFPMTSRSGSWFLGKFSLGISFMDLWGPYRWGHSTWFSQWWLTYVDIIWNYVYIYNLVGGLCCWNPCPFRKKAACSQTAEIAMFNWSIDSAPQEPSCGMVS